MLHTHISDEYTYHHCPNMDDSVFIDWSPVFGWSFGMHINNDVINTTIRNKHITCCPYCNEILPNVSDEIYLSEQDICKYQEKLTSRFSQKEVNDHLLAIKRKDNPPVQTLVETTDLSNINQQELLETIDGTLEELYYWSKGYCRIIDNKEVGIAAFWKNQFKELGLDI